MVHVISVSLVASRWQPLFDPKNGLEPERVTLSVRVAHPDVTEGPTVLKVVLAGSKLLSRKVNQRCMITAGS